MPVVSMLNLKDRAVMPPSIVGKITAMAATSSLASYNWPGRGRAPMGYVKGMGVVYGTAYRRLKKGDPIVTSMVEVVEGHHDVFDHLETELRSVGLVTEGASAAIRLRILHVILYALGMRESSGRYCEGLDQSADNTNAEGAECGPFQQSWDSRPASPWIAWLLNAYLSNTDYPSLVDIFKEGVHPKASDSVTYGSGRGADFQKMIKSRPEFAAEAACVGMRTNCGHWGPLERHEVTLPLLLIDFMTKVEQIVDTASPGKPDPTPSGRRTWGQAIADWINRLYRK